MRTAGILAFVVVFLLLAVWAAYLVHAHSLQGTPSQASAQVQSVPNGTTGYIEILNGNGFTMNLPDGTDRNVSVTATTTFYSGEGSALSTSSINHLNVGQRVVVEGSTTDGDDMTATKIFAY